tara:strand:+ start:675 stop:914 length:240 start_codon:yes stop_codon:yes gene_type:complete
MRWLIILFVLFLTGCSYTPVVDLRASKNEAQLFQRDLMECQVLAERIAGGVVSKVLFTGYRQAMNNCIEGRGHSVLTNW